MLSVQNGSNPLKRDIQLDGVTANSTLIGDASSDLLVGAAGGHTMNGGSGSDTYLVFANTTASTITDTGSSGVDSVLISGGDNPATPTLADGGTDDTLTVVYDGTASPRRRARPSAASRPSAPTSGPTARPATR